jgi:TPR repeat protein
MDDSESAIKYYRMAAEQDNSLGQYYLAEKYEHGEGVGEDIDTAIYWYRKSAMNGDEDAKKKLQSLGVDWLENKDE